MAGRVRSAAQVTRVSNSRQKHCSILVCLEHSKIRGAALSSGMSGIGTYRLQATDAAGSESVEARRVHEALDRLRGERRARH